MNLSKNLGEYAKKGHKHSDEMKKKIAPWGRVLSEETKRKISLAHKGKSISEEHRKNLVKYHIGKKLSIETRKKMSKAHKGDKASNWQGGITKLSDSIRGSIEIRLWREAVFARDAWICQKCGERSGNGKRIYLEAHHIKSFSKYPELRFAIDNGITLCKSCHKMTDNYAHKAK